MISFSVPFFIDKVELEKINIIDESLEPTFRSRLKTSLRTNKQVNTKLSLICQRL